MIVPVGPTARGRTRSSVVGTDTWSISDDPRREPSLHCSRAGVIERIWRTPREGGPVDEPMARLLGGRLVRANRVGVDQHDGVLLLDRNLSAKVWSVSGEDARR